ncbi:MAG TPA: hypothetical protein VF322_06000 [Gammaproteobacteria bacterium]
MRTAAFLAAASISAALAACGTVVERDGMRMRCRDKTVNVINVPGRLQVKPDPVTVCRGYAVTWSFRNPVAGQAARVTGKTGAEWLGQTNERPESMSISVPDGIRPMQYEYLLEIDGLGALDPRIVVQ